MSREAFEAWYDLQPDGRIQPWDVWQAAQADAFERAAKLCDRLSASNAPASHCALVIRALAKESGK